MPRSPESMLTPKLRFPEFRANAGWKSAPLSSVLSEQGLESDGKAEVHSVSLRRGVVPQVEHMGRSFSAADTSHYSLVKPFDVIYTKSPLAIFKLGIVKQHRGPDNALVSPLYGVFTPVNRSVGQLIEAYFDAPSRSLRFLEPLCQKGAKNTIQISNERFLSGELVLPGDEAEQQRIADCLTSLDELIAAQGWKVEALKVHKQGLMQDLFPREGETLPRLRFSEFRNDWHTTLFETLTESISSGKDKSQPDGIYDLYGSTGIIGRTNVAPYSGPHILVARVGANAGLLTKAKGTFGATDNTLVIVLKDGKGVDFFYHYLESCGLNKLIFGSGQPLITGGQLKSLRVSLPRVEEQQRIAACLSSLDDRIAAESEKLAALKTHKQGLMQQLFPFVGVD